MNEQVDPDQQLTALVEEAVKLIADFKRLAPAATQLDGTQVQESLTKLRGVRHAIGLLEVALTDRLIDIYSPLSYLEGGR